MVKKEGEIKIKISNKSWQKYRYPMTLTIISSDVYKKLKSKSYKKPE